MEPPEPAGDLLDRNKLITPEELADYLQIPIGTLEQWASRGGGPKFHKVGVHRRYRPANVREWLDAREREPRSEKARARGAAA